MVASSGGEACRNALRYTHNTPGMCLAYVRGWLEIGALRPSAISAWSNAGHKHTNDHNPPAGAPVFWRGGSRGFGHIALSLGNGRIRSTDCPGTGQVSSVDLSWINQHWGEVYLGWTEELNGTDIPFLRKSPVSQWAGGPVWVKMLDLGTRDSDSVARLCYRLRHHTKIPDRFKPHVQNNVYGRDLQHSVRYWQQHIRPGLPGPDDGSSMSNAQADMLFGQRYSVHTS